MTRWERITTADGSWTLRDHERDVTYRSVHGAATESDYVFVHGCGLGYPPTTAWSVLELGFGAAMNFHRTRLRCAELGSALTYVAIERAPVDPGLLSHDPTTDAIVAAALAAPGVEVVRDDVRLTIHVCDIAAAPALERRFDAFYHDPFGPEADPDAWSEEIFAWYRELAAPQAQLATYAVAGRVRRALAAAGWRVQKRPGPPGKREVLNAVVRTHSAL